MGPRNPILIIKAPTLWGDKAAGFLAICVLPVHVIESSDGRICRSILVELPRLRKLFLFNTILQTQAASARTHSCIERHADFREGLFMDVRPGTPQPARHCMRTLHRSFLDAVANRFLSKRSGLECLLAFRWTDFGYGVWVLKS